MSLSTFKDTADWRFSILAKHEFTSWQPVTLCCHLVCPDESQWELRAQDTAKTWMESLDQQVAYSATVPRTCAKKYQPRAAESSGIEATNMIVLKYPLRNVQPASAIFPFLTVRTKFYSADEVAQLNASAVVNMKAHVREVRPPQGNTGRGAATALLETVIFRSKCWETWLCKYTVLDHAQFWVSG